MTDTPSGVTVDTERLDQVAVIRFSNPPLGYIPNKGAALLRVAIGACLDDVNIRAIVLTGGCEGVFIRHADVGQIVRAAKALKGGMIGTDSFLDAAFPRLTQLLDEATKPVIAAINGVCMGGGLEIALACTMRIAGKDVGAIGLPEIRIDIFPGSGTQRLQRLVGWQRTRLIALCGQVMSSGDALAIGLVDEVAESPLKRALEVANQFARRNANAVAAVLRVTRKRDEAAGLDEELLAFAELLRDDPTVCQRLEQFVEKGERLDALD